MIRKVVGTHSIKHVLNARPHEIKEIMLIKGFESTQELRDLQRFGIAKKIPISIKSKEQLGQISTSHQGAALIVSGAPEIEIQQLLDKKQSLVVLLDGIEDPHNLGAILRTSWLLAVDTILISKDHSVGLTPTVAKVACGGSEYIPVKIIQNFKQTLDSLKEGGFWVYGLSANSKGSLPTTRLNEKSVLCIGSEGKGLRKSTEGLCDELLSLPQAVEGESYNASVAAGLSIYQYRLLYPMKMGR